MREYESLILKNSIKDYIKIVEAELNKNSFKTILSAGDDFDASKYDSLSEMLKGLISSNFIYEDDIAMIRGYFDIESVSRRFLANIAPLKIRYRRKFIDKYVLVSLNVLPAEDFCEEHQHVIAFVEVENVLTSAMYALCDMYISSHMINLDTMEYSCITNDNYVEIFENKIDGDIQAKMNHIFKNMCTEKNMEMMLEFVDFSTIKARLKNTRGLNAIFLGNVRGWCKAQFIPVDYNSKGEVRNVLFIVEDIDDEKRKEDRLRYLAEIDLMTGIMNRGSGQRAIQ